MFKFDNYPNIKKLHKTWEKLYNKSTHELVRIVDKKAFGAEARFNRLQKKTDDFELLYEKVIYEELVKEKPDIFNRRTEEFESWESLIGDDYDKIPSKKILILLVEQHGGIYRLPDNYYV